MSNTQQKQPTHKTMSKSKERLEALSYSDLYALSEQLSKKLKDNRLSPLDVAKYAKRLSLISKVLYAKQEQLFEE